MFISTQQFEITNTAPSGSVTSVALRGLNSISFACQKRARKCLISCIKRRVGRQIDPWRVSRPPFWLVPDTEQAYFSSLCQEGNGLVHASSLCADVALTFGTELSQRHLEGIRWNITLRHQLCRVFVFKQQPSFRFFSLKTESINRHLQQH